MMRHYDEYEDDLYYGDEEVECFQKIRPKNNGSDFSGGAPKKKTTKRKTNKWKQPEKRDKWK